MPLQTLHLQGTFSRLDKFNRVIICAESKDKLKSMKKLWNLHNQKPEGRSPITHDGFKLSVPKAQLEELKEKYIGAPVHLYVQVKHYNFKDRNTGNKMEGFSLILKDKKDISFAEGISDSEES